MMLVPRRNNYDLFDDFFNDEFFSKKEKNLMKTDIREEDDKYIIDMDLPGFKKENIDVSLNNGYLLIEAKEDSEKKEEKEGKYLRQERYIGSCSRSFYIGDDIEENDIHAEFKNGTLKIEVPKKEEQEESTETKKIEIK